MNIKLDYTPHTYQQKVHLACTKKSTNFWTIVCAGRQSGKSHLALFQTIKWAYENPNILIWYVTPSESQSKNVWSKMVDVLFPLGVIAKKLNSKGNIVIELVNKTKIEFKSAAAEDTLRGSGVHYLILDECAFIKQSTIEEIILPTMGVQGKKILVCSTPKGKNYFYELWLKGQGDNEDYKSFKFTSLDNPSANVKLIESFKLNMPKEVFEQEFLAEWTDGAAVFNYVSELATLSPIDGPRHGEVYYMGVDIALVNDYTVITVLNNQGHMVYVDRFKGLDAPEVEKRLEKAYSLFRPYKVAIEANNQGSPIISHLTFPVESFYTTEESKPEIINQLIAAFSGKEIRVLDNEDLVTELKAFVFSFSKTGKIRFKAAGGFHDDMVMSLAIAWNLYAKNKRNGHYAIYTETVAPKKSKSNIGMYLGNIPTEFSDGIGYNPN